MVRPVLTVIQGWRRCIFSRLMSSAGLHGKSSMVKESRRVRGCLLSSWEYFLTNRGATVDIMTLNNQLCTTQHDRRKRSKVSRRRRWRRRGIIPRWGRQRLNSQCRFLLLLELPKRLVLIVRQIEVPRSDMHTVGGFIVDSDMVFAALRRLMYSFPDDCLLCTPWLFLCLDQAFMPVLLLALS